MFIKLHANNAYESVVFSLQAAQRLHGREAETAADVEINAILVYYEKAVDLGAVILWF